MYIFTWGLRLEYCSAPLLKGLWPRILARAPGGGGRAGAPPLLKPLVGALRLLRQESSPARGREMAKGFSSLDRPSSTFRGVTWGEEGRMGKEWRGKQYP